MDDAADHAPIVDPRNSAKLVRKQRPKPPDPLVSAR